MILARKTYDWLGWVMHLDVTCQGWVVLSLRSALRSCKRCDTCSKVRDPRIVTPQQLYPRLVLRTCQSKMNYKFSYPKVLRDSGTMCFRIWYGKQAKRAWKWIDDLNSLYFIWNNRNWNWAPYDHQALQNTKIKLDFFLPLKGSWELFCDLTCHAYTC